MVWATTASARRAAGLHFHDLRHAGNALAADVNVSLRNLMARMGHDNERAALIYQHASSLHDAELTRAVVEAWPWLSGTGGAS